MKYFANLLGLLLLLSACQPTGESSEETASKEEPAVEEWIYLFDGTSTDGWRAYNGKELPPQWIVEDGVLTFSKEKKNLEVEHEGGKDIIYAVEEFDNFELHIEWKIPEGGNSGIFYHLKEGYDSPAEVSPEYQLIDDENYAAIHDLVEYNTSLGYEKPEQLQVLQQTAADYAMYPANDSLKMLHPAGEWNKTI
ncbi:MAG: DUF1080 domain-containing protein, partial [Bacteroidota bacterium]